MRCAASWLLGARVGYGQRMTLRRRKSKKARAADVLGDYIKLKAAGKAAKGAKKAAEGTAVVKVAKRTPLKKAGLFAGVTAAVDAYLIDRTAPQDGLSCPP